MAKNNRANMSNKYWENETPIITETSFGEVHYFKEAGKVQMYSVYENKDGELCRGKGCVWDNNEMEAEDAIRLVHAIMQGLIDVGIEDNAFADAYELLDSRVAEIELDDDSEEDTTFDEEFEDEEVEPAYDEMKLGDLKAICIERGLELPKKVTKPALVALLEADDESAEEDEVDDEEDAETAKSFIGKNIKYVDGELSKVNRKVKNDYIEWGEDAIEWGNYIAEQAGEIKAMPTKTAKQKKAQDAVYAELITEIKEWLLSWEDERIIVKVNVIIKELYTLHTDAESAIIKMLAVVDGMKF